MLDAVVTAAVVAGGGVTVPVVVVAVVGVAKGSDFVTVASGTEKSDSTINTVEL